jgi:type I restriction enzyme S subunit
MESGDFQEALKEYSGGAAIQNVASVSILKEILIPLPSISEQKRVIESVESFATETQHLESLYRKKLAALDDLKKSLLHQAFAGAL